MTGEYTYASPPTDRMGRHREVAELMNALYEAHGPGKFKSVRVPDSSGPQGEFPRPDFSNTIRWTYRT